MGVPLASLHCVSFEQTKGQGGECKDCQKKAALRGANTKGMGINCLSCEPKNVPKWKKIFENFENMFAEGIASVDIAPRNNIVK